MTPAELRALSTPLTDAEEQWAEWNGDEFQCVPSDFAREIERRLMSAKELRALLTWRMVSDPWPDQVDLYVVSALLEREAKLRGYRDWVDAYHKMVVPA